MARSSPDSATCAIAGTAAPRVSKHSQSLGPLLQASRQCIGFAAMQRKPLGVLPRPPQAGKGQLHRAGAGMKAQLRNREMLQQQAANAKPERITTGQQHGAPASGQFKS